MIYPHEIDKNHSIESTKSQKERKVDEKLVEISKNLEILNNRIETFEKL